MVELCGDARFRSASQSQRRVLCPAHTGALWQVSHVVLAVAGDYSLARETRFVLFFDDCSNLLSRQHAWMLEPLTANSAGGVCEKPSTFCVAQPPWHRRCFCCFCCFGVRGALWNAQILSPLITLAVGQVTTRDSVSIMPAGQRRGVLPTLWTLAEPLTGSD